MKWYNSFDNDSKIELNKGIDSFTYGGCLKKAKTIYEEYKTNSKLISDDLSSIQELSLASNSDISNSSLISYIGDLMDPKYVKKFISKTSFGLASFYRVKNDNNDSDEDYIYKPVHCPVH